jgi:hypothetical protein
MNFWDFRPAISMGQVVDITWDFPIRDTANRSTDFYQFPEFQLTPANFYEFLQFLSGNFWVR